MIWCAGISHSKLVCLQAFYFTVFLWRLSQACHVCPNKRIYIGPFSHPSFWMNYLLSHVHVEIWDVSVYGCHNNSATSASAFIIYILSYLKSQPISQAHFKEGRNKRRLQAGSRVELERTKTLFGFLEMSDVILGWRRIISIHKCTNLGLRCIPGVFSRIWSGLPSTKERSEIEWANVTLWNLNWCKCV